MEASGTPFEGEIDEIKRSSSETYNLTNSGTYRTRNPLKHQAVSERINVLSLERRKNRKILIRRKANCNTCVCILFLF
jgi:hypothetical protein